MSTPTPEQEYAAVPLSWVGPVRISGNVMEDELKLPMATYETPLWPSCGRGAKVSRMIEGGITCTLVDERMTRSVLFTLDSAATAVVVRDKVLADMGALQQVVGASSRFAKLININTEVAGRLLVMRFEFTSGDASGHNMATLAAENLMSYLMDTYPELGYGSISANYCTDKKVSAVNGVLGRGKNIVAEAIIPEQVVQERLRTDAKRLVELNERKNLIGSILAGSLRSANAHYANMLLGFYLATGQDAANIVEGSQGITQVEDVDGAVRFSCTLPNLIVGSVGNGKGLDFVENNLRRIGCKDDRDPGDNARRLAACCAAIVWCGELSLLAAQTNPGELMSTHVSIERAQQAK
ncbi:hydroxymethylglutaryl-CoA reductase [Corynebacterium sp. TAE3-ERU12]|uniref:hydroxymethylglutaryl-CoA reductase n=1 Tax=Corynebacterium sp. TAE3-ERU12 TaxID=2849491 RepID=UPI001C437F01|nr:hydroxymethylglutaryl-CoA reductase [Corynebacterium sp. TAE3-ERU12]MBV7294706.1 hydroxymethylglutaryl-CoA reductase [Corynebacterium sp. TAE3-ERU12]